MIFDSSSVVYACISKGTTILAEFTTGDPDLDALALKCLENAPQFHSVFSYNARRRAYRFLMDDAFVYFGIFDENLEKSRCLWLLNRIKEAFEGFLEKEEIKSFGSLASYCFQGDLNPILRDLLAPGSMLSLNLPKPALRESRNTSMESSRGHKIVSVPLLGNPVKGLKKKKRRSAEEDNNLESNNAVAASSALGGCVLTREYSVFFEKSGALGGGSGGGLFVADGREKAKQKWRRHVWVALGVDLIVCCVLFGIWLGICRGFKCMNG